MRLLIRKARTDLLSVRCETDRAGPCQFWCYVYRNKSFSIVADASAASAGRRRDGTHSFSHHSSLFALSFL